MHFSHCAIINNMSVEIKTYSSNLIERFLNEKKRISAILPSGTKIEHVGSSAIGIGGKNIIDILIGVKNKEEMEKIRDILVENGYFEGNDTHEDRIFLASKQTETGEGDFHIHICPVGENSYKDFIILRDFLKANPHKANEYLEKKYEFAKSAGYERKKYKILKAEYVSALLDEAKKTSKECQH